MYITDQEELYKLYVQAKDESRTWREDYHEFERLADNELMDDLDPTLPETNDGTLSAALYKLPKRIVNSNLKGRAKATDRDDAWLTELANIQWENNIIPNANSMSPFHRKWKDAVRKAAIYGSVPLITLFVERGDYTGADFIVVQPQDVTLEPGKVSDYDSDIVFWDIYYSKQQVAAMIETAKKEAKDGYNKWNIKALQKILDSAKEVERDNRDDYKNSNDHSVKRKGINFCVVYQRGVDAPFYMYHKDSKTTVREWTNPDPTGDIPVHFLYCYQDFKNPYGTGIVKLAGGTQNVLDYFRQADVLATQLGFRPPVSITGDIDNVDLDSIVYEQDAQWYIGQGATVQRQEISNQIYAQLPTRIQMYQSSLNKMIPMGDTSVSAAAGDPLQSKTPAGVKMQQQTLSIDDEDFKDNLYMTYEAVAESMINTHFANMQGTDLMKLSDEERDFIKDLYDEALAQGGLEFPVDEMGEPTNELEIIWDEVRATFDFEMEAENDKTKDEEKRLEALLKVVELRTADPTLEQSLQMAGKRLNVGELMSSIIQLTTDNDKIIEDITPEEKDAMEQEQMMQEEMMAQEQMAQEPQEAPQEGSDLEDIMAGFGVDESTAMAMLEAERQGFSQEEIMAAVERNVNG